jgi:predicted Rossmann fold flavoprotein
MAVQQKLVVIGGGAAGFFCAINAAKLAPQLLVVLVERTSNVLQKVKISGGGRCNTTHNCSSISTMASRYPRGERFVKKAFHHFFTNDTIDWFAQHGVALKTEPDGRMFPVANTSAAIIDCLTQQAAKLGIKIIYNAQVLQIQPVAAYNYSIQLKNNTTPLQANYVMLACGGFSKLSQYDWLQNLKLKIESPIPSLFTFNFSKHPLNELMGVVAPNCVVKIAGTKLLSEGIVLITHWGLSGPAILRLSAFAASHLAQVNYQFNVIINWCSTYNEQSFVQHIINLRTSSPTQKITNGNFTGLPKRLWDYMLAQANIDADLRWADANNIRLHKLAKCICGYEMQANGKTTFKEEFVTAGGIALTEIDVNTMMSKKHAGLFFGGEIMDVDGITGGYNFQHAWTSGFIAAKQIAHLALQHD